MKRFAVLCLLACSFSIAGVGHASPIKFDFTSSSSDYIYQRDGVTLTVSAIWDGDKAAITHTSSGLGVNATDDNQIVIDNSPTFDGVDGLDALVFTFDVQVFMREISFRYAGADDDFSVLADTGMYLEADAVYTFSSMPDDFFGREFIATACVDDSFRIKSLTVEVPIPAPEPATWLLLSVRFAGLSFWRKRH